MPLILATIGSVFGWFIISWMLGADKSKCTASTICKCGCRDA